MKQTGKTIRILLFAVVAALCITGAYRILSWKDTMGDYLSSAEQLYATPRDLVDVLFVGSSHCYAGVNPDLLWRDFGIAAFDMAISGQDKPSSLYYTKEALKSQSPKVIMVDLLATTFEEGVPGNVYRNMLSMRSSPDQVRMVLEEPVEEKADYILKWPVIHSRYRELKAYDFVNNEYSRYGRGYCYRFAANEVIHRPGTEAMEDTTLISDENRRWVDSFIRLAEKKGASLHMMILPYEMSIEDKMIFNGVQDYLAEKGIPCIDFNCMMSTLDIRYLTDFMDEGHLNYYGGAKVTNYLGQFLRDTYGIENHTGEPAYAMWDESLRYGEHLVAREESRAIFEPNDYMDLLLSLEDLTIVLRMDGDGTGTQFDLPGAVSAIGLDPSFAGKPGIAIVDRGTVLPEVPHAGEELYLNELSFQDMLSITRDDEDLVIEVNGEELFEPYDGLGVYVYDRLLGEPWQTRIFY